MIALRSGSRRIAVGLALAATLATSACAAGQIAETAQEKATLDGTNVDVGNIALRALSVQTPDAVNYPVGSNPLVTVVLVNNGQSADKLVSISSSVASGWGSYADQVDVPQSGAAAAPASAATASAAAGTSGNATAAITLPPTATTAFGVPVANGRVLALLGTKKVLFPGNEISITFTFAKAGSKTFVVPIQVSASNTGTYHPTPEVLPTDGASGGEG